MSAAYEAIVIGGGVNGLTAATLLARAGRRTLLLERREGIGGQARSAEFAPGFRSAALGSDAGWLPPRVASALGLAVPELVLPEATLAIRATERDWLVLSRDIGRTAEAIRRYSPADAGKWNGFATRLAKHAEFLSALYTLPPPDVDAAGLRAVILANVEETINDLLEQSAILKHLAESGQVTLVGAYYELATGRAHFSEPVRMPRGADTRVSRH